MEGFMKETKKKSNAGRKTKYHSEMPDLIRAYLGTCEDEYEEWVKSSGDKGTTYERQIKVSLPTFVGAARYIDISEETLHKWKEKHPKFKKALTEVLAEQKQRLIEKGLAGAYNSTIAKLILSSNHGMSDRQKNEHSVDDDTKALLCAALTKLDKMESVD